MGLYEDAVSDAKKLREVTEQVAKQKLMEQVAPKLRSLIERELDGSGSVDLESLYPADGRASAADDREKSRVTIDTDDDLSVDVGDDEVDSDGRKVLRDAAKEEKIDGDKFDVQYESLVKRKRSLQDAISNTVLRKCSHDVWKPIFESVRSLRDNAGSLHKNVICNGGKTISEDASQKLDALIREIDTMSKFSGGRSVREKHEKKRGSKKDVNELDVSLELVPGDEDEEAKAKELSDLLSGATVSATVEGGDESDGDAGGDLEGVDDFSDVGVGDEAGDEFNFDDLAGGDEAGDEDEKKDEKKDEGEDKGDDEIVEVDEGVLRREIRRLRRLREAEGVDASHTSRAFGDGDDSGDMFVDVDEDKLINALADELGSVGRPSVRAESIVRRALSRSASRERLSGRSRFLESGRHSRAGRVDEVRRGSARSRLDEIRTHRRVEQVRREIQEMKRRGLIRNGRYLSESRADRHSTDVRRDRLVEARERRSARLLREMRTRIDELNLFNAKLVFATRLLNGSNISRESQARVVEAIERAKSINEAKAVYVKLAAAIKRHSASRVSDPKVGNLSESRQREVGATGTSSKSTRSAAPAKSGSDEVSSRWATLAGINESSAE